MATRATAHAEVRRLTNVVLRAPNDVPGLPLGQLDMTFRVARRARLLGRLADRLEASGLADSLPQVLADQLQSAQVMAEARRRLALWELDRIAWATSSHPAPLILMKGCTYVWLGLPNAAGRVFADVDLLTAEDRLDGVEARLNEMGWETRPLSPYDQNYYRNWTHELPPLVHREREVEIDLHHNVLPRTSRIRPNAEKFLEQAKPLEDSRYHVLCDEDIVLHAMAHLMFNADLSDEIRDLVDVHDLLIHFSDNHRDFWQDLVARAEELGLERPAYYGLRYCKQLLKTPVPESVMQSIRRWGPPRLIVRLMDTLVPHALYPLHPDLPSKFSAFCRLLLFMRSHWIRMPPWLLIYHLSYKFYVTRIRRVPNPNVGLEN